MYATKEDIVNFLLSEIEPVFHSYTGEKSYRAACYLKDETYFPCVEFKLSTELVNRVISRLDDARKEKIGYIYSSVMESFLTTKNNIYSFHIKNVEHSPFALPIQHRDVLYKAADALKIELSWDSLPFVAEMEDGNRFAFEFNGNDEFLKMPDQYIANQINSVFPNRKMKGQIYSSRISFDCYIDGLI